MSVYDRLKEIEREGYKAALNGESITSHTYRNNNEQAAMIRGYAKGLQELKREREAKKEQK